MLGVERRSDGEDRDIGGAVAVDEDDGALIVDDDGPYFLDGHALGDRRAEVLGELLCEGDDVDVCE